MVTSLGFSVRIARRGTLRQRVYAMLNLCVRLASQAEVVSLPLRGKSVFLEFRSLGRSRGGFLGITLRISALLTRRKGAWIEWGSIIGTGPSSSENISYYRTL